MKQDTCQLLTPIDDSQTAVDHLLSEDYAAQQKFDGKRILLAVDRNSVTAHNRTGLVCDVSPPILEQARMLSPIAPLILDAEWLRETKSLHVFDLLEIDGTNLRSFPFRQRQDQLNRTLAVARLPNILAVRTEYLRDQKIALLQKISVHNLEGIVLKPINSPYKVGRQPDHFKFKLTAVSSFLITGLNQKQSVSLGAFDEQGRLINCGDVRIRNDRFKVREGMIIDVEYLHVFKPTNQVYQPRMKAIRDDLHPEACTLSQLRYKGTEITRNCDLTQFFAAAGTN
jgi:bifunctional non-homologous end joining protein LigD